LGAVQGAGDEADEMAGGRLFLRRSVLFGRGLLVGHGAASDAMIPAMDLADHFGRLRALLELERQAERDRFFASASRLSLAERDARGIAIADAEAVEEGGLGG